jgi:hypothetical protein
MVPAIQLTSATPEEPYMPAPTSAPSVGDDQLPVKLANLVQHLPSDGCMDTGNDQAKVGTGKAGDGRLIAKRLQRCFALWVGRKHS